MSPFGEFAMSIELRADVGNPGPLIPGAYERNTLTYRQPGSMGASGSLPMGSRSMDAATIADREREGGGAPSQRRRDVQGVWPGLQLLAPSLSP
jgi:hypothetical protein